MTDEEAALLRMIRHNPDDDLPRLVYADWLEENGQEWRASAIRSQCDSPEFHYETDYYIDNVRVTWNRGFISKAKCTVSEWEENRHALCERHPVQLVDIVDAGGFMIMRIAVSDLAYSREMQILHQKLDL